MSAHVLIVGGLWRHKKMDCGAYAADLAGRILLMVVHLFDKTSETGQVLTMDSQALRNYLSAFGNGTPVLALATPEAERCSVGLTKPQLARISAVFAVAKDRYESMGKDRTFELNLKRLFSYFFEFANFESALSLALVHPELMRTFAVDAAALLLTYTLRYDVPADHQESTEQRRLRLHSLLFQLERLSQKTEEAYLQGQVLFVGQVLSVEKSARTVLEPVVGQTPLTSLLGQKLQSVFRRIATNQPWKVFALLSRYDALEVP